MNMSTVEHAQLKAAERIIKFGSYTWNLRTESITWSPGLFALLERDPQGPYGFDIYVSMIVPEYRTDPAEDKSPQPLLEYPMILGNGRKIWVRVSSEVLEVDGDETMVGVVCDVTLEHEAMAKIVEVNAGLVSAFDRSQELVKFLTEFSAVERKTQNEQAEVHVEETRVHVEETRVHVEEKKMMFEEREKGYL